MRYSFLLASLMLLNIQSANAILMTGEGMDTGCGFIKWEELVKLPQKINALDSQVQTLRNACIIGSVFIAGVLIYLKWFNEPEKTKAVTVASAHTDDPMLQKVENRYLRLKETFDSVTKKYQEAVAQLKTQEGILSPCEYEEQLKKLTSDYESFLEGFKEEILTCYATSN